MNHAEDFSFTVELRDGRPNCVATEERYFALAAALTDAWGDDGGRLVRLLEERAGCNKEGAVGFSYAGDSPGKVRVFYMDDEQSLERSFFEAAAVNFGQAALSSLRRASLPVSAAVESGLRALLKKSGR